MAEPSFQQLTEELQRLTERVSVLERELGLRRAAAAMRVQEITPSVQPEPAAESEPASDLEANVGLRVVNRVGAVTLILGIAFFFSYAVQNNWIGESARVLLGIAAGLLLLAGGEWGFRRDQRVFAQGITGAGAAALYLSVFAAFSAYHLIRQETAFALLALVTAVSGYLATRYAAQAIAALALSGGFLAPVMLDSKSLGDWFVPLYVAALDAGFVLATARRRWPVVQWLALLGTFLLPIFFAPLPLHFFLVITYLIFATRPGATLFAISHLLFLWRVTNVTGEIWAYPLELCALSLAGVAVVKWRGWFHLTSLLVVAAGLSWFAKSSTMPLTGALVTLTLLFLTFFGAAAWRAATAPARLSVSELTSLPLAAAFYFSACYQRLTVWGDTWAALLAVLLACVYFALAFGLRNLPEPNLAGVVSGGVGTALFTLAIPIQFHAFRITVAWSLEGAALVWIAAKRRVFPAQVFGLIVMLCAGIRFAAMDLFLYAEPGGHTLLLNPRFATALALAGSFFLAAIWSRATRIPTWAPGVAGHLVLLTALSFEISDWARQFAAENRTSRESAALSILFAIYAVMLVALGTTQRSAGSRYMGLALIAAVVLKLYFYDVWQLDLAYRFIAFAALGALLLTISFLYSRFRNSVSLWLKKEDGATPRGASAAHPPQPPE